MSRLEPDPVTEWPVDLQAAGDAYQAAHEAGRTESFTFDLPRVQLLTANQRLHYAPKASLTKALRVRGFAAAVGKQPMERAHLVVHIGWPDKRRRDRSNYLNTIKPCLDGIVDAGLIPDDDDAHLIGPDLRSHVLGVRGVYRFRFDFTELTA